MDRGSSGSRKRKLWRGKIWEKILEDFMKVSCETQNK